MAGLAPHMTSQQYNKFAEKYNAILQKYSINHDPIDYKAVIVERPHENPWMTKGTRFWYNVQLMVKGRIPDFVLALVFAVGGVTAISFITSDEPMVAAPKVWRPGHAAC
jgi:hypothetical protein